MNSICLTIGNSSFEKVADGGTSSRSSTQATTRYRWQFTNWKSGQIWKGGAREGNDWPAQVGRYWLDATTTSRAAWIGTTTASLGGSTTYSGSTIRFCFATVSDLSISPEPEAWLPEIEWASSAPSRTTHSLNRSAEVETIDMAYRTAKSVTANFLMRLPDSGGTIQK